METKLSVCTILTLIFVVLKLTEVISWSWWWVLSPTIIPIAIALFLFILAFVIKKIFCNKDKDI